MDDESKTDLVKYFKTSEARKADSSARKLIESALDRLHGMDLERGVQIIAYSFLLGGATLEKYFTAAKALPPNVRSAYR